MSEEEFIIKFYSCDNEEQFLKDLYHDLNYLQQKNEQLKIQISAREEEYLKLESNWNELSKWLIEQEKKARDEVSHAFGYVLYKIQKLEKGKSE